MRSQGRSWAVFEDANSADVSPRDELPSGAAADKQSSAEDRAGSDQQGKLRTVTMSLMCSNSCHAISLRWMSPTTSSTCGMTGNPGRDILGQRWRFKGVAKI